MNILSRLGRCCGAALFFFPVAVPVFAGTDFFSRFETRLVSEVEPLKSTIDEWGSDLQRGERQWAVSQFEFGSRFSGVEFSVLQRALADLRVNADAIEFYSRLKNTIPLTPGETVPLHIRVNGFSAAGIRLGYRYEMANWTLGAGVAWLKTSHLMSGELNGQFRALATDEYGVDADVNYFYYRDVIFKRPNIETAEGEGVTIDVAVAWQPSANWRLEANARDPFTELRWEQAPYTVATAGTERKSYDEEGYAFFNPLFSGRQGYQDEFVQRIDPRYQLAVRHTRGAWSFHAEAQYQFGYGTGGVGTGYASTNGNEYKVLVWPEYDAIEFGFKRGAWQASLALDHISWAEMKSLALSLSYGY